MLPHSSGEAISRTAFFISPVGLLLMGLLAIAAAYLCFEHRATARRAALTDAVGLRVHATGPPQADRIQPAAVRWRKLIDH
jgi:hypothetical protein